MNNPDQKRMPHSEKNDVEAASQAAARLLKEGEALRGGILAALRRSPLVGADLRVEREAGSGRDIDL